jgi:adenine-specific DNA-methyltransferase
MKENYSKLKKVLSEIFQLNQADLDFGLYRILNQKRDDIQRFLDNSLLPQVKTILQSTSGSSNKEAQTELKKLEKTLLSAGMNPSDSPKVKELRQQIAGSTNVDVLEQQVFSHLTVFFKRYYDKGDFISKRRYKADTYAIPYEGEEVKLYWANHDQYYIKTSEYLKNYGFSLSDGKKVRFQLIEASAEKDNNKGERRFKIYEEQPVKQDGNTLTIHFTYEPTDKKIQQKNLNEITAQAVLKVLPNDFYELLQKRPTEKKKNRTLLDKHIRDFTARNTFDYFIHKDLGAFLRRELDFYIKSEILQLDDIDYNKPQSFTEQLAKINAFRSVAMKIIDFLAQLEDFQKRLWLKKKFVVETNYCITLDKIDEKFYPTIVENEAQWTEWEKLFAISEIEEDLFHAKGNDRLSILKSQPHLVLDTAFFSDDFKYQLIATFDNLDEELDGLLIHSENFQALNLLQNRYKEQVKCIYIDPPYNTGGDGFPYKDNYMHSSWISMIYDRIQIAKKMIPEDGALFSSINDIESNSLKNILNTTFGEENHLADFIWKIEGNFDNQAKIKDAHEYVFAYSINESLFLSPPVIDPSIKKNSKLFKTEIRNTIIKNGIKNPEADIIIPIGFPASFKNGTIKKGDVNYPKFDVDIIVKNFQVSNKIIARSGWSSNTLFQDFVKNDFLPVKDSKGQDSIFEITHTGSIEVIKKRMKNQSYVTSIIQSVGTTQSTSAMLSKMGTPYPHYPKPVNLVKYLVSMTGETSNVLDFFSGSGTTGHAVINLNREDNGKRKYILVEMGEYFNSVTKPRIQKVVYSADWKDGKPVSPKGSSHAFKYIRLESYEDTLNNLKLRKVATGLNLAESFQEDYTLRYWLDVETRESLLTVQAFRKPFDYTLDITQDNEMRPTKIDLVETFNYLIGLQVKTSYRVSGIHIVIGDTIGGEHSLVIWRDMDTTDNEALNAFFTKMDFNTIDTEFDRIYVNGDNNLENLKKEADKWKVELIEQVFFREM